MIVTMSTGITVKMRVGVGTNANVVMHTTRISYAPLIPVAESRCTRALLGAVKQ